MKKILILTLLAFSVLVTSPKACNMELLHDGDYMNQGVMYEVNEQIANYKLEKEKQAERRSRMSKVYKDILNGKYEPKKEEEYSHEEDCCDGCSIPCDNLGTFTAFAYCGCYDCNGEWTGQPTKSGTDYVQGRTIAVDPNVIPLGSHIFVEFFDGSIKEYIAEDTGNFSGKVLDVYFDNHNDCNTFGRQQVKVYLVKE